MPSLQHEYKMYMLVCVYSSVFGQYATKLRMTNTHVCACFIFIYTLGGQSSLGTQKMRDIGYVVIGGIITTHM